MADEHSVAPQRPRCPRCRKPATWQIDAQWTLFDFDTWYGCDEHVGEIEAQLERRTVDGQLAQVIQTLILDDDELGLPIDGQDR